MELLTQSGLTLATTSGLLTATGTETVYDTTVIISFSIGGKAYSKAAVTDGVTPLLDGNGDALTTLTANQGCIMLWVMNAAGTVAVFQGDVQGLDPTGAFADPDSAHFPSVDGDTWCPFAYQVLKAGATAGTITFGTSNWDATGFTQTIQNIHTLPSRPQIA